MTTTYNWKDIDVKKYENNYNEEGFWNKIKLFGGKLGAKPLYVTLLLFHSLPKVSLLDKAIIIGSLGYFISPLDIIPDVIPVVGYLDDVSVLMFAFYRIRSNIDDETRNKAKDTFRSIFPSFTNEDIDKLVN